MSAMQAHERGARNALARYVSDLGLALVGASPDERVVDITGSLMLVDVSGFTVLAERLAEAGRVGAEYVSDVVHELFTGLVDRVMACGGDVLEFAGDAMVTRFSGEHHERRAAVAAAEMVRFVRRHGTITTDLGAARVRVSCAVASGTQPCHVVGSSRRAIVLAGPVSSEMVRLEAQAGSGTVLVDRATAAALPPSWVEEVDGESCSLRLRHVATIDTDRAAAGRAPADEALAALLLPAPLRATGNRLAWAGELKQVAMAFVRLEGTDDVLRDGGAYALHRMLVDVSRVIDEVTTELGVCWLETQVDASAVRWEMVAGAPDATERPGERLLRAVRRVANRSPHALQIGAHIGVVYVGDMGHPQRCAFVAIGDATNLAARLMSRAASGQIVVSERLMADGAGGFAATPLEPFRVKGKRQPVHAFLLGAELGDAAGGDGERAPLVGRDQELQRLIDGVDADAVVEVVGDAGAGKSRLCDEARRRRVERMWFVVRGQPYERDGPYLAVRRLLAQIAGADPILSEHWVLEPEAVTSLVQRAVPDLLPFAPLVAEALGSSLPVTDDVLALDPNFRAQQQQLVLAQLVNALLERPAVLLLEDWHWFDDASRGVIRSLTSGLHPGVAVISTSRSPVDWGAGSVVVRLDGLDPAAADDLLLSVLPDTRASDATLQQLRGLGAGNPLFLIELARSVAASASTSSAAHPESIERLLAARIDALPPADRALIRDVSVLGTVVHRALAARVLDRPDVDRQLLRHGAFDGLLTVHGDFVAFVHDLARVAAYEGLSVRRRRTLHARACEVVERWGDDAPVVDRVAALAFHASGSARPELVECWHGDAAGRAMVAGAAVTAEGLLRDLAAAQRALDAPRDQRLRTARRLATAAERAGDLDVALLAVDDALRLAGESIGRAELAIDRARLLEKQGRYRAALTTTARALAACPDDARHADVRGRLLLARAAVRSFQSRWAEALQLAEGLIDDDTHAVDPAVLAQAHLLGEWCCSSLGLKRATAHGNEALRLLTELDDAIGLGNLLLNRGETAWRQSRVSEALADFRASAAQFQRAGDVVGAALAENNVAEILCLQSRLDEAETLLLRARRVTRAGGYPLGAMIATSGLSRVACWRGDHERAVALQSDALAGFRALHADDLVADSLVRLVEIAVIGGDPEQALSAASDASAAVRLLGDVPGVVAPLERWRGRALLALGRRGEARQAFAASLDAARRATFVYEVALAELGLARVDDDDVAAARAIHLLSALGVVAPPPGS
jgi:class 3 adenylate cyclase/tetratricopeptide (TPR) repeat protein